MVATTRLETMLGVSDIPKYDREFLKTGGPLGKLGMCGDSQILGMPTEDYVGVV